MRKLEAVEKADEGGKSWKRRGYAFVLCSLTSYLIEFKRRMRTRQHILLYFIIRQLNRMGKIIENSKEKIIIKTDEKFFDTYSCIFISIGNEILFLSIKLLNFTILISRYCGFNIDRLEDILDRFKIFIYLFYLLFIYFKSRIRLK